MRISLLAASATVLLSGCATRPAAPDLSDLEGSRRDFVKFLCSGSEVTPARIRTYLDSQSIHYSLHQNDWNGRDEWNIRGCGKWTATYTGRKPKPGETAMIIPSDIDSILNSTPRRMDSTPRRNTDFIPPIPPGKQLEHVFYDTMAQPGSGLKIRFDRDKNTATLSR